MQRRAFIILSLCLVSRYVNGSDHEVFVLQCNGVGSLHKPGTDFMDMGMDVSFLKRTVDAALEIVHDHVRCACSGISDDELKTSFTPNVGLLLRTFNHDSATRNTKCPTDMLQFDTELKKQFDEGNMSFTLPESCSASSWNTLTQCSFSVKFPLDAKFGENFINMSISECPNSIWPYISVVANGPLVDHFMKPCIDDSGCGGHLNCKGPVNDELLECHSRECGPSDPSSCNCTSCTEGYYSDQDSDHNLGCRPKNPSYLDISGKMIPDILDMFRVFRDENCAEHNPSTFGKNIQDKVMKFARNKFWLPDAGGYNTPADRVKFCGLDLLFSDSTSTMSNARHRQTMSRALSHLQDGPIGQIFNHIQDMMEILVEQSAEIVSSGRRLLQDPESNAEPAEEEFEFPELHIHTWSDESLFSPDRISGANSHPFIDNSQQGNTVNLIHADCNSPPRFNFMGGHPMGGMKAYFLKYPDLIKFAQDLVHGLVNCRDSFSSGSGIPIDQLRSRFLMFDPSFWLNIFSSDQINIGGLSNDNYDTSSWMKDVINTSEATCTIEQTEFNYRETNKQWQYNNSREAEDGCGRCYSNYTKDVVDCNSWPIGDNKKQVECRYRVAESKTWTKNETWEFESNNNDNDGCGRCWRDYRSDPGCLDRKGPWCENSIRCDIKVNGIPKLQLPATCTVEHFQKHDQCSFIYDNLPPFVSDLDAKIAFNMMRCGVPNENAYKISIDCKGSDCTHLFRVASKPCSVDSDCPRTTKCQIIELCDPIGDLLWGGMEVRENNETMNGACVQDDDACTNTQTFRNSLVRAILKINNEQATSANQHTGMCMPSFIVDAIEGNDDRDWLDDWTGDAVSKDDSTNIITVKGLQPFSITKEDCNSNQELNAYLLTWCCENEKVRCGSTVRTISTELVLTYLSELDNNQQEKLKMILKIAFSKKLSGVEPEDIKVEIILITKPPRRHLLVSYDYKIVLTVINPPDSANVMDELNVLTSSIKNLGSEADIVQTINAEANNLDLKVEVANIGVIKDPVDEIDLIPTQSPISYSQAPAGIGRNLGTGIGISFILVFVFGFVKGTC